LPEIRLRRIVPLYQVGEQIDKGEMMGAACTAGSEASTAQGRSVGGQKQLMHLLLVRADTGDGIADPGSSLRIKLIQFRCDSGHRVSPKLLSLLNYHTLQIDALVKRPETRPPTNKRHGPDGPCR